MIRVVVLTRYEELEKVFKNNKRIKFRLFSLEYIIEIIDNKVVIYPEMYPQRKQEYFSFDAIMNYYHIYNEPLIENIDRIILVK